MPPRRRRSGNSAASTTNTHQQTLSFGGSKSRVSKPTSLKHSKDISSSSPVEIPSHTRHKKPSIASKSPSLSVSSSTTSSIAGDEDAEVHEDGEATAQLNPIAASSKSENVVREQARVQAQLPRSEEDKQALALTDAHIREYWATEESSRRAPRVHQQGLSMNEKILRHFDLSSQYGPCIGIARIKRWRRAHMLNLNPPIEVLAVLLKGEEQGVVQEKAYIDELLS